MIRGPPDDQKNAELMKHETDKSFSGRICDDNQPQTEKFINTLRPGICGDSDNLLTTNLLNWFIFLKVTSRKAGSHLWGLLKHNVLQAGCPSCHP